MEALTALTTPGGDLEGHEMVKKAAKEISNEADCQAVIHDVHKKTVGDFLESTPNLLNPKNRAKAKDLQQSLLRASDSQDTYVRAMLEKIYRIHDFELKRTLQKIGNNRGELMKLLNKRAYTLPLWVKSTKEDFPVPGVGSISVSDSQPLEVGDWVAAYHSDNWIIAEVSAVQGNNKYELLDLDATEETQKFTLGRKRMIPLPKYRANPLSDIHALFPLEAIVLAMYPQTTAFYKGVIVKVPATPNEDYQVTFEDPTFKHGYSPPNSVAQNFVVNYKEIKGKKKAGTED